MTALEQLRRMWTHAAWADTVLLERLREVNRDPSPDALVWREYAHVLGAEAVWLARLEQRAVTTAVWPTLTLQEAEQLSAVVRAGYDALLDRLDDDALDLPTTYVNSAGQEFTNRAGDILLHVMLHGQYHRGKINLMLRQDGAEPVPSDYIAFVRGAAAATTPRP